MKKIIIRTLKLFCAFWLIMMAGQVYAQQGGITLSGKITNLANSRPIRQANVSIEGKGVGTSTNAAGMFLLLIPQANLADTLKISCIGYNTQRIPIKSIKNTGAVNVSLEKSTTILQEVTVTYYDAPKIMQKSIARIPENYISTSHILRGFYRMYTSNDKNPLQLSEAVFDVYNFGYGDTHADIFRLIKARSEKNERDFNTLEFGQKPNSVFEQDVVNHLYSCDFLNERGLANHDFHVNGIVDIKGYKAYEIAFTEKPDTEGNTYRGTMYIDTKTYAFVYFDFGFSPTTISTVGIATYAKRSLMRLGSVSVSLLTDHTKVGYQEVGGKWVLSDVEGENSIGIKSEPLNYDYVANIKFNYQITAVDIDPKEAFNSKIGRNDNINAYKSNGDEKFWKDYNIILSDYNVDDIFKDIKAINKTVK
jgi:hypothetical protein